MRPSVRPVQALALTLALALLVGCDPTTGSPPPVGAPSVPAYRSLITSVTAEELGSSWRPGCPVGPADLRRVRVDYWGYDGAVHRGDLIVHRSWATPIANTFRKLYDQRFQIRRIHPVTRYGSDDGRSMEANNTSAFNCRAVTGGTSWSEHSYGTALDLNPVQNPYVTSSGTVLPGNAGPWVDRSLRAPGMVHRGLVAFLAFEDIGWRWGGDWTNPRDYQHFSASGR